MGLLDAFTGGKSSSATDALKRAEEYFARLRTPTVQELTLPDLQRYVEAGIMTPAEARAYIQERNAYDDQTIDQTGTAAMVNAINQLAAAGDDTSLMDDAALANLTSQMNTSVGGQRGAIEQAMAARGTPRALIQAAMASQALGQDAQRAHLAAVNAHDANYRAALDALSKSGQLGTQLQGQQNQQANTVAQAANAMQQFNAQNQQQAGQFNAANQQAANAYNAANRQQIANQNTGLSNYRTEYNAKLPQQVFGNELAKTQGKAGAATNIGNLYNQQGQQNAGITSGLINMATNFIPTPAGPAAAASRSVSNPTTDRFAQSYQQGWYAHGGIVDDKDPRYCNEGYVIPGEAEVPGDSLQNDDVPIMASPGEAIIPRSSVAENPEIVSSLIESENPVEVQDVVTILKAMRALRTGVA